MKDDDAKARYFTGLSLFMFSMTGIVLADNFVMIFIFWELVGLQFLPAHRPLVSEGLRRRCRQEGLPLQPHRRLRLHGRHPHALGHHRHARLRRHEARARSSPRPIPHLRRTAHRRRCSASSAARSASPPSSRSTSGCPTPWKARPRSPPSSTPPPWSPPASTCSSACRSPSATEAFDGFAGTVIAWTGGITALLAALMATQQDDIKRVLAYSTLSQLGYMVMAVGLVAGEAGMFHLFTHAWFKALLFLGSGAVIYACHHEQDIWKMGGLLKKMPITGVTFAIGTAALIAVPWSPPASSPRKQILAAASRATTRRSSGSPSSSPSSPLLHDPPLRRRLPRQAPHRKTPTTPTRSAR